MKGVILTAGAAKRLRPITNAYGKVLTPIYDKPMIDYAVSLLISCSIRDIVIVCNRQDEGTFKRLFSRFNGMGVNFKFCVQKAAKGTANALRYAKKFVAGDDFVLLFGDNVFVSKNMQQLVKKAMDENPGLTLFASPVPDPRRFGVVEVDQTGRITNLEEKPEHPKTNLAATGLYIYKGEAMKKVDAVKLSPRGEYELTDVIKEYISEGRARVVCLPPDCKWLDTGTHDALLACSQLVAEFEEKNGLFGSLEAEMFKAGLMTAEEAKKMAENYCGEYKARLLEVIEGK